MAYRSERPQSWRNFVVETGLDQLGLPAAILESEWRFRRYLETGRDAASDVPPLDAQGVVNLPDVLKFAQEHCCAWGWCGGFEALSAAVAKWPRSRPPLLSELTPPR